jgi:NADPH:quinone reductase-like Zn-dependent oxidoreductase
MKAFRLKSLNQPVVLEDVNIPKVQPGWVLIKIEAFGLNHSEKILRQEEIEADYISKPVIPGIECVGTIEEASDTNFVKGEKVMALMGGMGRSFDGSYAQYVLMPTHHVYLLDLDWDWKELAALPETYWTVWGSLTEGLRLKRGESLLVRGATCAAGFAAIDIAKAMGCTVYATARKAENLPLLDRADEAVLDTGKLEDHMPDVNKVLDLVGPKTLRDSLRVLLPGGIVCCTGILGGEYYLNGFDPIKAIPNGRYLTGFFSNWPDKEEIQEMVSFLKEHGLRPRIGAVYPFFQLADAIKAQDDGHVHGKIVITDVQNI